MTSYGYSRVSSADQASNYSLQNQQELLVTWGVPPENVLQEVASASTMNRPILQKLLKETLKGGDCLVVSALDRFSRQLLPTLFEIHALHAKGVVFVALDFPGCSDFDRPINVLVTAVYGFLAESELENRKRRQREGIEKAKAEGKYRGRKTVVDQKLIKKVGHFYHTCAIKGEALGRVCGVSRNTALKALKLYNASKSVNADLGEQTH